VLDVITQRTNLERQGIPVDFCDVGAAFVDAKCLERLPSALGTVVSQVRGDGVGMKLRIEFPAGVVMIHGDREIARGPISIRAIHSDTRGSMIFKLLKSFGNSPFVRLDEPL